MVIKMNNTSEDNIDYSSLKTVNTFDSGDTTSTMAMDVLSKIDDIQKFSPTSLLVESLIDQICKLLNSDAEIQKQLYLAVCQKLHEMNLIDQSYQVEEFQFMRNHYQNSLYQLIAVAKSVKDDESICSSEADKILDICTESLLELSRYSSEFKELEFLAKGGFGKVYKVQNKLDGGYYAIKKICLRFNSTNSFLRNLKEVKMLAKLNHVNIVQYKAAWLEPIRQIKEYRNRRYAKVSSKEESDDIIFESDEIDVIKNTEENEMNVDISGDTSNLTTCDGQLCEYRYSQKKSLQYNYTRFNRNKLKQCAALYIQMQLCEMTLREWLDLRNSECSNVDIDLCLKIFRQILSGVVYIHSQGIVHHDIKPSNIFISKDLTQVQVGDFGLSCCLITHDPLPPISFLSHQHGTQLGTKVYAAPEQIAGKCNPKSDVYSLGIILFEMIYRFTTAMERSKTIGLLKSGHIPSDLTAKWPELANIIRKTITSHLNKRPSSIDLQIEFEKYDVVPTDRLLEEKDHLIEKLKEESLLKDKMIEDLKRQLLEKTSLNSS